MFLIRETCGSDFQGMVMLTRTHEGQLGLIIAPGWMREDSKATVRGSIEVWRGPNNG